jgi:hypothetical protein
MIVEWTMMTSKRQAIAVPADTKKVCKNSAGESDAKPVGMTRADRKTSSAK